MVETDELVRGYSHGIAFTVVSANIPCARDRRAMNHRVGYVWHGVRAVACGLALLLNGVASHAQDAEIPTIAPADGLKHVGQKVRVRMSVISIGGAGDSQVLNSLKEWDAPGNLQVYLRPKALEAFAAQGITKANLHFWNKTVEVTGVLREMAPGGIKLPAIEVESPDDIRFILVSTRSAPDITELVGRHVDLRMKNDQWVIDAVVVSAETRATPKGLVSLKVKSGTAAPKVYQGALLEDVLVDDVSLDLTFDRNARLLTLDQEKRKKRLEAAEETEQRVIKRGGKFWEFLTTEETAARVQKGRDFLTSVKSQFPQNALRTAETKYYLLLTDLDVANSQKYLKYVDTLYDEMCRSFAIPLGKNIWGGKCLIVAFQNQPDFARFEKDFMKNMHDTRNSQGICHVDNDGQVVISVWRGNLTSHFAAALVHETSHGFVARYRSNIRASSWLNEGMADWISDRIVKSDNVSSRRAQSAALIQKQKSLDGFFHKDQIAGDNYGVASAIVDGLIEIDPVRFRRFFIGIKEGMTEEQSLQEAFQLTHQDLAKLYGRRIGVADLTP